MLSQAVSIVIGGQCLQPARSMVLQLGRRREPPRPEGGTPETPGHVQPHSLLRESVTSGDLHRHEPYFILPDEGPALHHPRPPLVRPEARTKPRGKADASGTLGDHRSSAGGKAHQRLPGRGPTSGGHPAPCGAGKGLAPGPSPAAPSAVLLAEGRSLSWGRHPPS